MNFLEQSSRLSITPDAASSEAGSRVNLRLYVAGLTPNSQRAVANLEAALVSLAGGGIFQVEYIDVLVETTRAAADNIIITPTLFVIGFKSRLVIIGDLSDAGKLNTFLKTAAMLE